jgi:hypothetical protein
MVTKTFEPIRPLSAPDGGEPYCSREVIGPRYRVFYGESHWPSKSYWLVPVLDYCSR